MEEFKKALILAAQRKETSVKAWIDNKKRKYDSEDAFYADSFSMFGLPESKFMDEACKSAGAEFGLSERDTDMLYIILTSAWNDALDWATESGSKPNG